MNAVQLGTSDLRECPRCEGLWADVSTLEQICADRETQAAVLGAASLVGDSETVPLEKVRYLPCPICNELMHRVNFARCSHVVVDVCKGHGTWFDRDELRRIVEFIRAGGLDAARARELAELETRRRELAATEKHSDLYSPFAREPRHHDLDIGVSAVASLIKSLLR
jgi:Zn-finger nucleic acid-binding protein